MFTAATDFSHFGYSPHTTKERASKKGRVWVRALCLSIVQLHPVYNTTSNDSRKVFHIRRLLEQMFRNPKCNHNNKELFDILNTSWGWVKLHSRHCCKYSNQSTHEMMQNISCYSILDGNYSSIPFLLRI